MKNSHAKQLISARRHGVNDGMMTMALVLLPACDNVLQDYLAEDSLGKVLTEIEDEVNRIYKEVEASVPTGEVKEMAEKLVITVNHLREKRGMTPLLWTE